MPPGEGRAPAAGTNHAPLGDRQAPAVYEGPYAPPGEGRAPAASANHAPPKDCQAPALDEGPFLSRTQGSLANPDRVLKYVPTSDQGDRDCYTQLTHAVDTNNPADNSDVWVPVTRKGVKTQVDFSPGGFSSSYKRGCLLSGKNKFSGSAN